MSLWYERRNPMRRVLAALTLLLAGALVASAIWILFHPAVTPFIVPGATDIQVVTLGWGQRQINYRTPGPPYAWYVTLTRNLETGGYRLLNPWRPNESPTYEPIVILRFEREYATLLREEVVLTPDRRDPQRATIIVRQHISIPWWETITNWGADRTGRPACLVSYQATTAIHIVLVT
jgi:hypothetical protein